MSFRKYRYSTSILAAMLNKFGTAIRMAYSVNPMPKKSAETILTKLLTTKGRDAVSAINPQAMINGKIMASLNFKARTIASTIGVKINAAPSFANKAATTAPNMMTRKNIRKPLPLAKRAMCKAAHSKNPISSRINEMMIKATNVNVAFQTMPVTSQTSPKSTTPNNSATTAPAIADQPIDKPLGCQITNINVTINIKLANQTSTCYTTPCLSFSFIPSAIISLYK